MWKPGESTAAECTPLLADEIHIRPANRILRNKHPTANQHTPCSEMKIQQHTLINSNQHPRNEHPTSARKVDVRLPGKGNSVSHGPRPCVSERGTDRRRPRGTCSAGGASGGILCRSRCMAAGARATPAAAPRGLRV